MDILDIGTNLQTNPHVTLMNNIMQEASTGTYFDYGDEIRITIQSQYFFTLPSEGVICIQGYLKTTAGKSVTRTKFVSNVFAYLFSDCRYILN